ncbi:MAG: RNA polymerase sigma factor [Armatimonadota bacterium]
MNNDTPTLAQCELKECTDPRFAFNDIICRYERQIFNLVYRYTGDYDDACDIAQEVFVNAYKSLSEFRGDCKIYTWLCQIAINLCRSYHRRRQREQQHLGPSLDEMYEDDSGDQSTWEIPGDTDQPDVEYERRELRQMVHKAIQTLPPNHREVLLLRDIEGLSYQEISAITGLPIGVVKTRLHRARLSLKKLLEPVVMG